MQLGHFLHEAGRSYRLFERAPHAGSFWDTFPVHRKLISVNSRVTGSRNAEFNMRHDWNSLLDSDVPPMTTRTKDRWPRKELLTDYLADFAQEQVADGKISFDLLENLACVWLLCLACKA